jgi:hypothetical protein
MGPSRVVDGRTVKAIRAAVTLVLSVCGVSVVALAAPRQATETIIWGRVIDAVTGAPITGAVVAVRARGARAPVRPQVTDAQGRFLFRVTGTSSRISVTREGYVHDLPWDAAIVEASPPPLIHTPSPIGPVVVRMWPSSEISGAVFDRQGNGIPGITVRADPMPRYPGTGWRLVHATTDDRGEYRIADVRPGSYIVGARLPAPTTVGILRTAVGAEPSIDSMLAQMRDRVPVLPIGDWLLQVPVTSNSAGPIRSEREGVLMVLPSTYFPAARDPAQAEILTAQPGRSLTGINLVVDAERGYRIEGTVREHGRPKSGLRVAALVRTANENGSRPAVQAALGTTDRLGRFLLVGVPAGVYRVIAFPSRPLVVTDSSREVAWAEVELEVGTDDVRNLELDLASLPALEGRIASVDEPSAPPLPSGTVAIAMEADVGALMAGPGLVRVSPDSTGRFSLNLVPGEYAVQLSLPVGWAVHSITLDAKPLLGRTLHRRAGAAGPLRIGVTSRLGAAIVSVRPPAGTSGGPHRVVLLFPAERATWPNVLHDTDRFKVMPADAAGRAEFGDLLAGDYLTVALGVDHPAQVWRHRQTLERLAPHATSVRVPAGGQVSVVVDVAPR